MTNSDLNWIANYIWGIADDVLRDLYQRGKYRDVILPMTVLRRLDAVLEDGKADVLAMKETLDQAGIVEQEATLRRTAGQAFYNTSKFTLRDLRSRASRERLEADFLDYLDGYSRNVQDILDSFEFRNQVPKLSKADALGTLIERVTSPGVNLSSDPVRNADGSIRHPGLDNHGMGTIFEELVRRFNEENNEAAGEHWTPRDAVKLMAKLVFLPIADEIESGTYLLYDGACGTGGMLTVAEETLQELATVHGKEVSTHLYGQDINAETYAICKADLLLKGEGDAADNVVGGPEHSTLSNDAFPSREFDFMLSNPPYGKSWKTDLELMGGKKDMRDPRFVVDHTDDPEYSLVTRSSDGQMLFLANKLSKMKKDTRLGSRIAEVHNGSSLFTGDAGQGREQHPALDHRERLARSHRRAPAQPVLQHRHRDVRVGSDQPQARPATRQGAAHRRDRVASAPAQEPGQEELRTGGRRHRANLSRVRRLRGDGTEPDLQQRRVRLLEGDGRAAVTYRGRRSRARVQGVRNQGTARARYAKRKRPRGDQAHPQAWHRCRPAARAVRNHDQRQVRSRRIRAGHGLARHGADSVAGAGRDRSLPMPGSPSVRRGRVVPPGPAEDRLRDQLQSVLLQGGADADPDRDSG